MLRIEMSGLTRAELRRLLAAAEARGQAELAEGFRAELAARAAGGDDGPPQPMAFDEFDEDEPGPITFHDDEPGPILAPRDPTRLAAEDPTPLAFEAADRRARAKRQWPVGLVAVAVLAVGGATVWGVSRAPEWPPEPRAMTFRSASTRAPVAAPPPKAPPPSPPAVAEAPPPEPTPQATAEPASKAAAEAAPKVATQAAPEPGPRRVDPCARPPTPADRLLCNDLALNLLERELRDAYGRALSAGADPAAVRASQAEWRRARDPTSDPRALAGLYDRRIRELKAMTASASAPTEAPAPPLPDDRQRN